MTHSATDGRDIFEVTQSLSNRLPQYTYDVIDQKHSKSCGQYNHFVISVPEWMIFITHI